MNSLSRSPEPGAPTVAQALLPAVSRLVSTPGSETSVPRSGDAAGTSARATGENSELFLDIARELLGRGHQMRFRAKGGSMHPTIRDGEAIIVEPVPLKGLKKGDIAFYHAQRGVTAHRVVGVEGGRLRMRGDAASSVEEPREPAQVLGQVVAVERKGRRIRLEGFGANLGFTIGIYWCVLKRLLVRTEEACRFSVE